MVPNFILIIPPRSNAFKNHVIAGFLPALLYGVLFALFLIIGDLIYISRIIVRGVKIFIIIAPHVEPIISRWVPDEALDSCDGGYAFVVEIYTKRDKILGVSDSI